MKTVEELRRDHPLVPDYLIPGLHNYGASHCATGGFLNAVLSGDSDAAGRADSNSRAALFEIIYLVQTELPAQSWGSPEKVKAWLSETGAIENVEEEGKPKIFVFVNAVNSLGHMGMAMAEDGHVLAQHACSNEAWVVHDMGLRSDWKHELYDAHYPDGWSLVWVEDPKTHEGMQAAYALNQELAKEAGA